MYKCVLFVCAIHDTCMYREADYCKAEFRACHFLLPCDVCKLKKIVKLIYLKILTRKIEY